jgi:uncharacterized membrane protein
MKLHESHGGRDMKIVAGIALIVGIILLGFGVFQWQDGLNKQELRGREVVYPAMANQERIQQGKDQEVMGLTLLAVGGVVTIGSGIVLLKKQ